MQRVQEYKRIEKEENKWKHFLYSAKIIHRKVINTVQKNALLYTV